VKKVKDGIEVPGCVVGVSDGEDDVDVVSVVEGCEGRGFFCGGGEDAVSRFVEDEGIGNSVVTASIRIVLSNCVCNTGGRW
jgi:hypothetical protein